MKTTFILLTLFLVMLQMSVSCSYKPQLSTVPLLEEKGDLQIDGGISPVTISTYFSASYAITNHFSAQIFGDIGGSEMRFWQGALGYFNKFQNNTVFESYSGFGYGYANNGLGCADPCGSGKSNHYVGYTQINFGKNNEKLLHFDYGISLKLAYVFSEVDTSKEIFIENWHSTCIFMHNNVSTIVVEPNTFIRFGGPYLKFFMQANYCFPISLNHKDEFYYFPFNFGLGLSCRFSTIKKNNL